MTKVDSRRVRAIKAGELRPGVVVYWMSRDQRVHDNYALLHAQELAAQTNSPLGVLFCLVPEFLGATIRQYGFMLTGLAELERELSKLKIPLILLTGSPGKTIPKFVKSHSVTTLISDFSPLRINRKWNTEVASAIDIPFFEVDAHNIVPCWEASDKREYAAYTIRPKINRKLPDCVTDFPRLKKQTAPWPKSVAPVDWSKMKKSLRVDTSVGEIDWLKPGEKAAHRTLKRFMDKKLTGYADKRNDPTLDWQSNLSPYLHFGQISAQRIALEAQKHDQDLPSQETFLEELIIRRELSDNFCFYEPEYDSPAAFPDWARQSLDEHLGDPREYLYDRDQFDQGRTHDDLWNAAQMEMVLTGKMHGYLRMYWAKKILEWTPHYDEAVRTAIYLNDRYELDGRDPNGYAGVAWSVGGVHDRPWFERDIFGKVRYMSYGGCKRKFDVAAYVERINGLKREV